MTASREGLIASSQCAPVMEGFTALKVTLWLKSIASSHGSENGQKMLCSMLPYNLALMPAQKD
jgi:hypothetical protein